MHISCLQVSLCDLKATLVGCCALFYKSVLNQTTFLNLTTFFKLLIYGLSNVDLSKCHLSWQKQALLVDVNDGASLGLHCGQTGHTKRRMNVTIMHKETGVRNQCFCFVSYVNDICRMFYFYLFNLVYVLILRPTMTFFLNLIEWFCCLNLTGDVTVVSLHGVQITHDTQNVRAISCYLYAFL